MISQCEEIEGQYLFCYHDDDGAERSIESTDVNAYLKDVSGQAVSAKDFRTWSGSVIALSALLDLDDDLTPAQRKRAVNAAVEKASEALGNTKAVCRSSYVHPRILAAAETGELAPLLERARSVANEKPTPELVAGERLVGRNAAFTGQLGSIQEKSSGSGAHDDSISSITQPLSATTDAPRQIPSTRPPCPPVPHRFNRRIIDCKPPIYRCCTPGPKSFLGKTRLVSCLPQ